ncbi:stretch-activated cation channel Mid1 [Russula aff. rugulosa BPL654]|nr:stretch-activated cation channel Mid1 [Russula aff. rugulosa BPL654]
MLWPLVLLFSLPCLVRPQSTLPALSFNTPLSLSANNFSTSTSTPLLFSLPSSSQLTVSVALCAAPSSNAPSVFVSNSTNSQLVPGPNGGSDVFEVTLGDLGLGNLTLDVSASTGLLAVYGGTTTDSLEIGVSQGATPIHEPLESLPYFGDSTANEALLFSPPFFPPPPPPQPTYPNYTLPQANTTPPSLPPPPPGFSSTPNFTLFLAPLDTACAIRTGVTSDPSAEQSAQVLEEQMWLRDERGWRREWLVGRLATLTNYSVYAIQDGTRLSGPIYFATKSASFSCQLVHGLPYCPTTAYSVPLPEPPDSAPAYNALLVTACGRDFYSPLQTCADCQAAYRRWLCAVSLPRCGEFPQDQQQQQQQQQAVVPALSPQPSGTTPRNAVLGNSTEYTALLPCIETCNAADRACPVFLGFRCPDAKVSTAQQSYGIGFIDSADGDDRDGGVPGSAQDQWGNVYCNGN